jgi:hypothetical protein
LFTFKVENEYGDFLELTHSPDYTVTEIEGLSPPKASINTSVVASFDGSRYNSSRMGERNIVITAVIEREIEANRIRLYRYFKPKKKVRLYYKNGSRDVSIDGYVEDFQISPFDKRQKAQVSIICPEPFFQAIDEMLISFSTLSSEFYFPFAIEAEGVPFSIIEVNPTKVMTNNGDIESGLVILLQATGEVKNPRIYNVDAGEFFGLRITMHGGDAIAINTNKGQKSVSLRRKGRTENIINSIQRGSSWLQIRSGENTFTCEADEHTESLICTFRYTDKFEGV